MNTPIRAKFLDMVRSGAAVLLAISMVALAADVYAQSGARQSPIDIDKEAAVEGADRAVSTWQVEQALGPSRLAVKAPGACSERFTCGHAVQVKWTR